ncbi:hypothetical protein DSC45_29230 [Streptomyces sp. YIM 130001]|uniref:hypothetical protein n=1 Tax=Streptomyces sp. YIM 130001 TaxID=2259644 RepID=UPI000E64A409|nr:hypothetical protein [Streptomyces sp. YIM 130001]RII11145.1 hypothetical protein DSC45_29230 [Streptomyces sp. YIM 130001]
MDREVLGRLNSSGHRTALNVYLFIVLAHWAEHLAQPVQIYVYHWPVSEAGGVLGIYFPWLVTSEWMHYGDALLMLAGLMLLRLAFTGPARTWWNLSLGIQVWHHLEHLLLVQALTGAFLLGRPKQTSIIQLVFPRVEPHVFYNALVFVPMVVAMLLHRRPAAPAHAVRCGCARPPVRVGQPA